MRSYGQSVSELALVLKVLCVANLSNAQMQACISLSTVLTPHVATLGQ